jgi:hypothetical protein
MQPGTSGKHHGCAMADSIVTRFKWGRATANSGRPSCGHSAPAIMHGAAREAGVEAFAKSWRREVELS